MQELREGVFIKCAYRNCDVEFVPSRKGQLYCCTGHGHSERRRLYMEGRMIPKKTNINHEKKLYDRPFTHDTDMMIVADDMAGRSLVVLAGVLRRSAESIMARLEEIKESGTYNRISLAIERTQRYSAEEYARGKSHLSLRPYGADGY